MGYLWATLGGGLLFFVNAAPDAGDAGLGSAAGQPTTPSAIDRPADQRAYNPVIHRPASRVPSSQPTQASTTTPTPYTH